MSDVRGRPEDTNVEDLMGAAALGLLDASEQAAFDAWLANNEAGRREFAELLAAVDLLSLSAEESAPSAALRDRIATAVGASPAPSTERRQVEPVPVAEARGRVPTFLHSPAGRLIAAAAVLVIVVVGAFAVFQSLTGDPIETIAIAEAPEGFEGSLAYNEDEERLEFRVETMPEAPDGQVYQVWLIKDDQPESKGVMTGSELDVDANRSDYDAFAITLEPGPDGSAAPTSPPILVAPLASQDEGGDV